MAVEDRLGADRSDGLHRKARVRVRARGGCDWYEAPAGLRGLDQATNAVELIAMRSRRQQCAFLCSQAVAGFGQ